jgi:hypothetical protein
MKISESIKFSLIFNNIFYSKNNINTLLFISVTLHFNIHSYIFKSNLLYSNSKKLIYLYI